MKQAAITQARVVGALILRETRVRYGQSQIGYMWALIGPMIWITAISVMFSIMGAHAPTGGSHGLFVGLGYLSFSLYRDLATQLGHSFNANAALLNFPIVKEIDTIIARAILECATMIVIMTIVISGLILVGDAPTPNDTMMMLAAFIGLALLGTGVGLINAVISTKLNSWMNVYSLFSLPLLWISGVFYSMEMLPKKLKSILAWNPIMQGVEGMRKGYYHNYRASELDLYYLYAVGIGMILIGLASERAIRIRNS